MAKFIFNKGDNVWSPIYGDGKVIHVDHCDDTMKVEFEDGDSWWYTFGGIFKTNMHGKWGEVRSLFPAGSRIVTPNSTTTRDCEEKKPVTFKKGDKVIWLKPIEMEIVADHDDDCVKGKVTLDCTKSYEGVTWNFRKDSGIWNGGKIKTHGILVHPGFTITSGPEPERKPTFKDKEFVLVRDYKKSPWKLAAFKGYDPEGEFPYNTYNDEAFKMCIPYAGNEYKMGEVTED